MEEPKDFEYGPDVSEEFSIEDMLTPEGKKAHLEGKMDVLVFKDRDVTTTVKITSTPEDGEWMGRIIPNLYKDEEEAVQEARRRGKEARSARKIAAAELKRSMRAAKKAKLKGKNGL